MESYFFSQLMKYNMDSLSDTLSYHLGTYSLFSSHIFILTVQPNALRCAKGSPSIFQVILIWSFEPKEH